MSLPQPGTVWPPPELRKVFDRVQESQVWWDGDTVKLNDYYLGTNTQAQRGVGSRWRDAYNAFWGRQATQTTQPIKRLHVPIAGVITKLSATALFNEPLRVLADEADANAQDRVDEIFNNPLFHSNLFAAGETCSALMGSYQRVVWDPTIADNAWLDFVDPDCAIPEYKWGRLVAVNFWSELASYDDRTVWRHFERHEPGRIVHALYVGTPTDIGHMEPLDAHDDTKGIVLDGFDENIGGYVETGVKELTAGYVPNVTPNPEWRNDPTLKYLGRADISADVIPLLHEIDRVYSSLMRDFRIAQARMFASENVLTTMGRGKGMSLSEDQEIFTQVGSAMGKDGSMESLFQFHQPAIRVLEHDQGGDLLLREVLRKTGYSPMSLGMSDEVAQTATEASGKKELTVTTTQGKARHWGGTLGPLATTLMRVDAIKFPGKGVAPTEDLKIDWPKFAREPDLAKGQTVQAWATAQAASTRTMVAYLHEDWDDAQIDEEVGLIDKANELVAPDFGGGFGGDQPPLPTDQPPADDTPPVKEPAVTE